MVADVDADACHVLRRHFFFGNVGKHARDFAPSSVGPLKLDTFFVTLQAVAVDHIEIEAGHGFLLIILW